MVDAAQREWQEKAEKDPKYRRRNLFMLAGIYGFGMLTGISRVVEGSAPLWSLLLLPIPFAFVWVLLRAANRIKAPSG